MENEEADRESEYIALSEYTKQVSWPRKLFWEFVHFDATRIMMDSTGTESIAENNAISASSKYIDMMYHHVKSLVTKHIIKLEHVLLMKTTAYLLTKVL